MSDETMKNEKNLEVSDAAVSGPLWIQTYESPSLIVFELTVGTSPRDFANKN